MSAPRIASPHDVPNLRLWLLDQWRSGGLYEHAARVMRNAWQLANPYGWREREESEWHRLHLRADDLALWWVSAEMVDEISHVAAELPDDVRPEEVPGLTIDGMGTRGLVVLEKSMTGLDSRSADSLTVDGFCYGGTRMPPLHGKGFRQAVSVASYRKVNFDDGLDADGIEAATPVLIAEQELTGGHPGATRHEGERQEDGGLPVSYSLHGDSWMPLGRSDWPLEDALTTPVDRDVTGEMLASHVEDRRWLAALHLVAADHRVASVRRERPAKREQRRPSERKRLDPTVRVVYLRRLAAEGSGQHSPADGHRKAPRAHIVRSHPRWQAYGPDRTLRKLILVPRHSRGGGGEPPTEGPPQVKAVVR